MGVISHTYQFRVKIVLDNEKHNKGDSHFDATMLFPYVTSQLESPCICIRTKLTAIH